MPTLKDINLDLLHVTFMAHPAFFSLKISPTGKNLPRHLFSPPFWRFVEAEVDSSVDSGGVGCHFVLQSQTSGSPKTSLKQTNPNETRGYQRNAQKGETKRAEISWRDGFFPGWTQTWF